MLFAFTLAAVKISLMVRTVQSGKQNKKGHTESPPGTLTRKMKPSPMPLTSYPGEGDISGRSLCLKLELECLLFGSELSNSLKELLITCCMSADFTSHKVSGVTSRGSCSCRFLSDQLLEVVVLIGSLEVALVSFHFISEVQEWQVGSKVTPNVVTVREGD